MNIVVNSTKLKVFANHAIMAMQLLMVNASAPKLTTVVFNGMEINAPNVP